MSSIKLRIVVAGAGLSGLSTAVACALAGHQVTVLESAKELAEVGAGLQLTPNSTRLLSSWGLLRALEATAAEPTALSVHRYADGKVLACDDDFHTRMRARYRSPFLDVHRVDLQRALAARAEELGVKLELGRRVAGIEFEGGVVKTERSGIASGEEGKEEEAYEADLIVAADGLWSRCRECWLGRRDAPLPTGDLAYRIVLAADSIGDPELRRWITEPKCRFWIGPDAHVVAYSVRNASLYNIVLLVPDDLPGDVAKQPGSLEEMRRLFAGWDPVLRQFLENVESVDKWKLMHREELPAWVNEKGNFVMVGDSCHPMLPYLAQGANSSIEDGAVLGGLLKGMKSTAELKERLNIFQRLRKARGEAIVRETFKQRESFHMPDGPRQEARDALFLGQLGKEIVGEFPSRWTCPVVQPWLYGYDAEKEVATALEGLGVKTDV